MSKHKARQIARITQATLALIGDEGLSRLSISRVADAAGVTRQTVYNYFPDVDAIIAHALEEHGKAMERHLLEIIVAAATPREKLVAFAQFQIELASSGHENISLEAGLPIEVRQRLDQHSNSLKNMLQRVIGAGIKSGDFDPAVAGELVWEIARGGANAAAKHPERKLYFLGAVEKAMMAILLENH
ncbi:hypothetical protein MNBD_ALPHA12-764 [hydrothermal vent metagenome]|uniref:HTH tetR-type domain-containing protein n=1 Tax=hydrothermal vent metagenome TaxID=652676 RepID=A0A3B0TWG2_9ZZZZ